MLTPSPHPLPPPLLLPSRRLTADGRIRACETDANPNCVGTANRNEVRLVCFSGGKFTGLSEASKQW